MSFNVQNAVALEIEEGVVKTIHDKNNVQLWGAVGYDVKYKGDTQQTTISGINLLPPPADFNDSLGTFNISCSDGVWTFSGTSEAGHTQSPKAVIAPYTIKAGDYFHYNNTIVSSRINIALTFTDSTTFASSMSSANRIVSLADYVDKTISTVRANFNSGYEFNGTAAPMIINNVSTVTEWQPFVGGIPSPNPDYPQTVNVVTGTQTVSFEGATYSVRLGTLELAKSGTYQDYIYKSGGNWYKHGEIGKVVLTGTSGEAWTKYTWEQSGDVYFAHILNDAITGTNKTDLLSNNYTVLKSTDKYAFYINNQNLIVGSQDLATTAAEYKTWLSTHNTTVYYALATATDELIVDADLVSDLDAIQEFMKRYGYTATVSGNLPIIIDRQEITS